MTPVRVAAGLAAVITAVLLQAVLIGPLSFPLSVSLPAVLVAAVAVQSGPATGMSFGFAAGLITDLASNHPLGVLALVWLALGLAAGTVGGVVLTPAPLRSGPLRPERLPSAPPDRIAPFRRVALAIGLLTAAAGLVITIVLTLFDAAPGPFGTQVLLAVPSAVIDAILALAVWPACRAVLRSSALRPAPAAPALRTDR